MEDEDETAASAASPNPPRVAIYMSSATIRQCDAGKSDQERDLLARVSYERGWIITEERFDDGSDRDVRPGLKELLTMAGSVDRTFDVLFVDEVSRLGRSASGQLGIVQAFESAGVQVVSLLEGQGFQLFVRAMIKEQESHVRRQRSRRAWGDRKAREENCGNNGRAADPKKSRRACPTCGTEQTGESAA